MLTCLVTSRTSPEIALGLQGTLDQPAAAIRCESPNATLLQLVCPSQSAAAPAAYGSSPSCDMQLPLSLSLSTRGIAFVALAVEDYDNGGPVMRPLRLLCTAAPGSPTALDVRAAVVTFEVTNVVRPIFGHADFAEGANESETRRLLSAGAPHAHKTRHAHIPNFRNNDPVQAKVPLRSLQLVEGCSRCMRIKPSARASSLGHLHR